MTRRFFLCYLETTRRCNLSCPYCMSRLSEPPERPELTGDEIKHRVLDEVKKYTPDAAVAFSGGEFLQRPDALDILRYNASLGLWSFINTNGTTLTPELARDIRTASDGKAVIVFPLNSVDDAVHSWSRADSLSTVARASRACVRRRVPFFFLITISTANLPTLRRTMRALQWRGIPMLRAPFVPRGAGRDHRHLCFTRGDMERVIHPALRDHWLSYVSYTPFFAAPEFIEKQCGSDVILGQLGCQAAKGFIGVSAEGEVTPCVQLLDSSITCGNVRDTPLLDIITKNATLVALRAGNALTGKCGRCRYQHTCGGCRALAYYHSGDVFAEDPTCFFEPVDETTVSPLEPMQNRNTAKFIRFLRKHNPWKDLF